MPVHFHFYHVHGEFALITEGKRLVFRTFPYGDPNCYRLEDFAESYLKGVGDIVTVDQKRKGWKTVLKVLTHWVAHSDTNFPGEVDRDSILNRYAAVTSAEASGLLAKISAGMHNAPSWEHSFLGLRRLMALPVVHEDPVLFTQAMAVWEQWQVELPDSYSEVVIWFRAKLLLAIACVTRQRYLVEMVKGPIHRFVDCKFVRPMDVFQYAYLLGEMGEHEEAAWAYRNFIEKEPNEAVGYNNLGNEMLMIRQLEEALKWYSKALEFDPNYSASLYNRASVYDDLKNLELAKEDLMRLLEIDRQYADAHNLLALIALEDGDPVSALVHAQNSLQIDPNDAYHLGTMAEVQSALGNTTAFYSYLQQAVALDPEQMKLLNANAFERHKDELGFQQLLGKYPRA